MESHVGFIPPISLISGAAPRGLHFCSIDWGGGGQGIYQVVYFMAARPQLSVSASADHSMPSQTG